MSRNLLRKTKRENVQTLLYQTLNFARVVVDTDPYKGSRIVFYKFTMSHGRSRAPPLQDHLREVTKKVKREHVGNSDGFSLVNRQR